MVRTLMILVFGMMLVPAGVEADEGEGRPIVHRLEVRPNAAVFKDASHSEPIELSSAEDAAAYFDAAQLALLNERVDWECQVVLVFAWRGSGQDRMEAEVSEDEPDTVEFVYTPGRTRDLRPHTYVFVLEMGVVWGVGGGGR